jgi:hypothetical protein
MPLSEQIAEALYCAFWDGKPPVPTDIAVLMAATKGIDSELPIDAAWRAVADECIRQMEWARDQCRDCVGGPAEDTLDAIYELKLTAAPPDWSPPK